MGARGERRRIHCRAAAGRAHPRARVHRPDDDRHGHLGDARRKAAAAWRLPSVHSARPAALHLAVSRLLAAGPRSVRGIRPVAQPDRDGGRSKDSAHSRQRAHVGPILSAVATFAAHDRGTAAALRSLPRPHRRRCGAVRCARRAACYRHRQSQARRPGPAERPAQTPGFDRGNAWPDRRGRRLDPRRRGERHRRRSPPPQDHVSRAFDDHRAAPSPARRCRRSDRVGSRLAIGAAVA